GLSMEARMTLCNMSIEAGARAGLIAPDEITFSYLQGRRFVPPGEEWERAKSKWKMLRSDAGATFDSEVKIDCSRLAPYVTWGTNPAMAVPVTAQVPDPGTARNESQRRSMERALDYMGLRSGTSIE